MFDVFRLCLTVVLTVWRVVTVLSSISQSLSELMLTDLLDLTSLEGETVLLSNLDFELFLDLMMVVLPKNPPEESAISDIPVEEKALALLLLMLKPARRFF